ncbi:hypothetical protein GGX14DRAFT_491953, partial [Mycena pura]
MVVEDTVRYRYPKGEASKEWEVANPHGAGIYHLEGKHQHHCIETFGQQLTRTRKASDWGHLQHCLKYLREMAMCQPDLTLEPGDFTKRNFTVERWGAIHICRDLEPVYDSVGSSWREWVKFRKHST